MAESDFKKKVLSDGIELIYRCARMTQLVKLSRQFAKTNRPVLILGETGTGKELFARLIHRSSDRKKQQVVNFNAGGFSTTLAQSELFGHEKGAFTGANKRKKGLFHLADGGSLFLDEIGELPLDLQPLLLRALQEGEIWRVGATNVEKVNARVISATNLAPDVLADPARFRPDLLSRLAFHQIHVPPLRHRGEDMLGIADAYVKSIRPKATLSREAQAALLVHDWPGNVRELQTVLENAMALTVRQRLEAADIAPFISGYVPMGATLNRARQLRVLDHLFRAAKAVARSKITEHLDLPKGSAARVFRSLLEVGLIEEDTAGFALNQQIQSDLVYEQAEIDRTRLLYDGPLKLLRRAAGSAEGQTLSARHRLMERAFKIIGQDHTAKPTDA